MTIDVPFVDLRAQYRSLKVEIDAAIHAVLDSAHFILGRELEEFEHAFARYIGVRHAIGVGSGTEALALVLRACGIGPGDEVVTAVNTYIATCEAITAAGATPRWVDADERTYNLDPAALESAITGRTKAILPVHLYGQPADMTAILDVARRRGLMVIEDCAQSVGAKWQGRTTGTFGQAGCFSFFPAKNLGAYGDSGAVVTDDAAVAERIRMLRNHGQKEKYVHLIEGGCNRLDNLQAAVLGVKLPYLDRWNEDRRRIARRYDALLRDVPGLVTPYAPGDLEPVYHLYVIQVPARDRLQKALAERGIQTGIHYPIPLHEQPAYAALGYKPGDFPVASQLSRCILSLPMFPELTTDQIAYVVDALRAAIAEVRAK